MRIFNCCSFLFVAGLSRSWSSSSCSLQEITVQGLSSFKEFQEAFKGGKLAPARLPGLTHKWKVGKWTLDELVAKLGGMEVWPRELQEADPFGAARTVNQTVQDYIASAESPPEPMQIRFIDPGRFCIFETMFSPVTLALQGLSSIPKVFQKVAYAMPTFGLSSKGTGVGFHKPMSGDTWGGWYAQLHGSTTWSIRLGKDQPKSAWPFDSDSSDEETITCTLEQGDAIFIPEGSFRAWRGNSDVNLLFGFQGPMQTVDGLQDTLTHITKGDVSGLAKSYDKKNMSGDMPGLVRHALQVGHTEILQKLHDLGAVFEDEDDSGYTNLHIAASMGQAEAVRFAIQRGALFDARRASDGRYPIHMAATTGHRDVLNVLLAKAKKSWKYKDNAGKAAIHLAAMQGHSAAVETLVAGGTPVDLKDGEGFMPLHWAAEAGNAAALDKLLDLRAGIEAVNKDGESALYRATVKGHSGLVNHLLDNGANIEAQSKGGQRPVHVAAYLGLVDMLKLLHKRGADLSPKSKGGQFSPEALASHAGHKEAQSFIRRHMNIKEPESDPKSEEYKKATQDYAREDVQPIMAALQSGHIPLLEQAFLTRAGPGLMEPSIRLNLAQDSIRHGHMQMIEFLTKEGKDLKEEGAAILMLTAAKVGNTKLIDWFARGGLDVNFIPTHNGSTGDPPLLIATAEGHVAAVKLLLSLRADPNYMDDRNITVVQFAVMKGSAKVLAALLKTTGPQAAEESSGRHHLHAASAAGHSAVVKVLLDARADVMALDKGGAPPHFLAVEQGHLAVTKLLLERGAADDHVLPGNDEVSAREIAAGKGHVPLLKHFMKDLGTEALRDMAQKLGKGHGAEWQKQLEDALELDKREENAKTWQKVLEDPEKKAGLEKFNADYAKLSPKEREMVDRQMNEKGERDEAKEKYEKAQQAKRKNKRASASEL